MTGIAWKPIPIPCPLQDLPMTARVKRSTAEPGAAPPPAPATARTGPNVAQDGGAAVESQVDAHSCKLTLLKRFYLKLTWLADRALGRWSLFPYGSLFEVFGRALFVLKQEDISFLNK